VSAFLAVGNIEMNVTEMVFVADAGCIGTVLVLAD